MSCPTGNAALPKMESIVIDDHWLPNNEPAKIYTRDNETRLRQKAAIKKDLNDAEFKKSGTLKEIINDFGAKYKVSEVESVHDYFKMLDEANAERLFFEALRNKSDFEGMRDTLDEYLQHDQVLPDAREDLRAYVDKIGDLPKTKA